MVEPLKKVLVRRPDEAFGSADPALWHYVSQPDLERAQAEHDGLVTTLREAGCEVLYTPEARFDHRCPIFATRAGTPILQSNFRKVWNRTLRDLGLPHCSPHSLRRSFVDIMFDRDVPPHIVQSMAGHKSIEMTYNVYKGDATEKEKAQAAKAADEARVAMNKMFNALRNLADDLDKMVEGQ